MSFVYRVSLPVPTKHAVSPCALTTPAESRNDHVMLRTRGRILVVDDEPTITEFLGRALAQDGYTVDTAKDGISALIKIRWWGSYDLIVTGVMMPRLGGFQLYRELARWQ